VSQTHRYRVLGGTDVPAEPLELARHIVAQCAEAPVTFHAMLETLRRDVVEALGPQLDPETADVCTRSLLADPRDVLLAGEHAGVSLAFIEQRVSLPGLLQQWVTLSEEVGGATTLHMRLSRRDPLVADTVTARLRACQDAGVLPPDASIQLAVMRVLTADVGPSRAMRVELGAGTLLGQSFYEGSHELLINLEFSSREPAPRLLLADIWQPHTPVELRRYGTAEAALRAPSVAAYSIHSRVDGPLTGALLAARVGDEELSIEWDIAEPSQLCGVAISRRSTVASGGEASAHVLDVELDVRGNVDFEYGPDPEDLVVWISERARVELQHLHWA